MEETLRKSRGNINSQPNLPNREKKKAARQNRDPYQQTNLSPGGSALRASAAPAARTTHEFGGEVLAELGGAARG